jgi:hypothetical protein
MSGDDRTLVLVAGSGRSGTSLVTGMLQRLGMHVPQPEVPADATNPRGFAESQWVVDFHTGLLRRAAVQVSDARPAAWAQTAELAVDDEAAAELRAWLREQLRACPHVVVKDPRLSWFLPLWRRCAEDVGVEPRTLTMLRHPAAVVDSKQRWYGGWQGEVARTAGWVNQTLFTERATRDGRRVFVRYDDLLADWTVTIGRVGAALGLPTVVHAKAPALQAVHEFVDPSLSRSRPDWGELRIPQRLREQADTTWALVSSLATAEDLDVAARLDTVRAEYVALYEEAESIARSSVVAARRPQAPKAALAPPRTVRVVRRVPVSIRRRVPLRVRARVARSLRGRRVVVTP